MLVSHYELLNMSLAEMQNVESTVRWLTQHPLLKLKTLPQLSGNNTAVSAFEMVHRNTGWRKFLE
jgi:hypothetical protein